MRRLTKFEDLWQWTQSDFLPGLFPTRHFNGRPLSAYDHQFLGTLVSYRLGPPRIRQLRLKEGKYTIMNLQSID